MIPGCYLVCGEEKFLVDKEVNNLVATGIDLEQPTFSLNKFVGKIDNFEGIINSIQSQAIFGISKQVVVIYDLDFNTIEEKKVQLFDALNAKEDSTRVVFSFSNSLDKRKTFVKELLDRCEVKEFKQISPWETDQVKDFVYKTEKSRGYEISDEACDLLIEIIGTNLLQLDNELIKLEIFIGDKKSIDTTDVLSVVKKGNYGVFDIVNYLQKKVKNKVLNIINNLVESGEDIFAIIGFIQSQIKLLILIKEQIEKKKNFQDIASILKKNPYYIKNIIENTKKWNIEELKNFFLELTNLDYVIKSGKIEPKLGLEIILIKYC